MGSRRWVLLGGLVLCGWFGMQIVSPLLARQDTDPGKSENAVASNEEKDLNVRYAQAQLKLMEATLAEFAERNRRNPNTIRPAAIQLVRGYIAKARQRVELAQGGPTNASQAYVLRAEADLRLAEDNLKRSEAVNKQLANTVSAGEMARLSARRDLARVKVEKARHLASESPLSNVQFEIDELRDAIQELQLLESTRRRGS
jgi:hypothetical protein